MFKNILVIICFSLILYSCGANEPEEQSSSFFPLKVGNKWVYDNNRDVPSGYSTTKEVVSKQQFAGRDYYQIITSQADTYRDTAYYRIEDNKLIKLVIVKNEPKYLVESIYADFSIEKGASFKSAWGDLSNADMYYNVSIKNKTEDSITFFYDSPNAVDEEHSVTFLKGVGISETYSDAWGIHSYLIHYELK